jgi:MoaA/NifB/PqqE/SkfB family radical SAM enzyme
MSREEFAIVLEKLKGQTDYIYYHLMGEPLTHPLLPEFIKMAGECGYKSIITTNGTLLKKRKEELLSAGLHKVNISLHSFEEGNDENYTKYVGELTDFAKSAANQGIIVVFRLWNKGFDGGRNEMALKLLRENIEGDWIENTRGIRIRNKLYLEWGDRFEWPDSNAEIKGSKFFCYGLKDQFGILCDGTVVPCCLDSDGVINLGNIFNEDIGAILNSQRAKAMVEGFKCGKASEDLCKRCGYAQRFV